MTQDFSKDDICITIFISSRGLIMMNKSSLSLVQSVDHDEQSSLSLVQSVDHDEAIFTLIGPVSSSSSKKVNLYVDVCITSFFLGRTWFLLYLFVAFLPCQAPQPPSHNTCQCLLSDRLNPPAAIVHEYGEFSAKKSGII
jgi:hypothetical protein